MKINIKLLAIFLAIALVLIEAYLITSSVLDKNNENNQIQSFCTQKCGYEPSAQMWQFSGDSGIKGFTTKEGCFGYCSKVKMGFAYILESSVADFLGSVKNIFKR